MSFNKKKSFVSLTILLLLCTICSFNANAHNINYALESAGSGSVIWFYIKLGFEHIVPLGLDHILFVVSLCLLNNKIKTVLWQATAFTVAHSITLALSMKNIITLPGAIVEPIIALSIMFVAIENLIFRKLNAWRIGIVFLFGLIHGLGFASVLNEVGLPRDKFITALISFNAGVELGQMAVIAAVFAFILSFEKRTWYKKGFVYPASFLIIIIAAYWAVERMM